MHTNKTYKKTHTQEIKTILQQKSQLGANQEFQLPK